MLILAPLNFGSTRAGGSEAITHGCSVAVLLWAASLLLGGPPPRLPFAAVACVTLLILAALPWITGLASPTSVASFTQAHFAQVAARWPYSLVWRTPANALPFTLALAASVLPLIDLARERGWLLAFSLALAGTGAAVGLLALLQNATQAPGIYWRHDGRMPGNFAGTFFHHTSAGAYFNTAWPLAAALAWMAWQQLRAKFGWRALVLAVLGGLGTVILVAAHGSHVSRLPQLLALGVAPFLILGLKIPLRRLWPLAAVGAALTLLLVVAAGRTAEIGARWRLVFAAAPAAPVSLPPPESAWPALMRDDLFVPSAAAGGWFGDRRESWRTARRAIAARPLTGHGPGNWMGAASRESSDPFVRTFFQSLQFAYQDVLQFATEWGVPATLAWWGLLTGAVVAVLRGPDAPSPLHRALGLAAAGGLAAVLLQSQIDFPLQIPAVALNAVVLAALCWAAAGRVPPESAPAAS